MNIHKIQEQFLPLLEKPTSIYELSLKISLCVSTVTNYLKILEAAGCVTNIKNEKGKLWYSLSASQQAEVPV